MGSGYRSVKSGSEDGSVEQGSFEYSSGDESASKGMEVEG